MDFNILCSYLQTGPGWAIVLGRLEERLEGQLLVTTPFVMYLLTQVTSCPGCRKPLPRCALCLVNMVATTGEAKSPVLLGFS